MGFEFFLLFFLKMYSSNRTPTENTILFIIKIFYFICWKIHPFKQFTCSYRTKLGFSWTALLIDQSKNLTGSWGKFSNFFGGQVFFWSVASKKERKKCTIWSDHTIRTFQFSASIQLWSWVTNHWYTLFHNYSQAVNLLLTSALVLYYYNNQFLIIEKKLTPSIMSSHFSITITSSLQPNKIYKN